MGAVGVEGDAQKLWTQQPLYPHIQGNVVCVLGSGISRNPNHGGTDSILPVLTIGDETSCLDNRLTKLSKFQELADLGCDSVPDWVERHVEDSVDGFGGEVGVSALGEWE